MITENENSPLELAVLAGRILLSNGAEIFRVQETMERIAASYHMDSFHVYTISNGIFACGTENGIPHTAEIRHVPLAPVHLGRVAAVNQISREIAEGKHTIPEAFALLKEIEKLPFTSGRIQILATGMGSACFCYLFGGSPSHAVVSLNNENILAITGANLPMLLELVNINDSMELNVLSKKIIEIGRFGIRDIFKELNSML